MLLTTILNPGLILSPTQPICNLVIDSSIPYCTAVNETWSLREQSKMTNCYKAVGKKDKYETQRRASAVSGALGKCFKVWSIGTVSPSLEVPVFSSFLFFSPVDSLFILVLNLSCYQNVPKSADVYQTLAVLGLRKMNSALHPSRHTLENSAELCCLCYRKRKGEAWHFHKGTNVLSELHGEAPCSLFGLETWQAEKIPFPTEGNDKALIV